MIDIFIDGELKSKCPEIKLGCLQAQVDITESCNNLCDEINEYCNFLMNEMKLEELSSYPRIKAGREVYKKLGKSPSKYRLSAEALIRRVLQGKGVYKINNLVEINNLISLKSKLPVGSYDLKNLQTPITLSIGKEDEQYKGIGKELINIENLPVLVDSIGSFGSPTSDSERAMITNNAKEILMCIFCFDGDININEYLDYAKNLLTNYANAKDVETKIIE